MATALLFPACLWIETLSKILRLQGFPMRKIENQNVLLLLFQIIRHNLLESVSLEITSQSLVNSKIDELERSLKHFSLEKSTFFWKDCWQETGTRKATKKLERVITLCQLQFPVCPYPWKTSLLLFMSIGTKKLSIIITILSWIYSSDAENLLWKSLYLFLRRMHLEAFFPATITVNECFMNKSTIDRWICI